MRDVVIATEDIGRGQPIHIDQWGKASVDRVPYRKTEDRDLELFLADMEEPAFVRKPPPPRADMADMLDRIRENERRIPHLAPGDRLEFHGPGKPDWDWIEIPLPTVDQNPEEIMFRYDEGDPLAEWVASSNPLPDSGVMANGKPAATSAGRPWGFNRVYHGDEGHLYMTRAWIGRLRVHLFHRGDQDPDPHDHPWGFWTFPLTAYVEEETIQGAFGNWIEKRVVPAWRWSYRPAKHTHRVLGRGSGAGRDGSSIKPGKILTIVWRDAGPQRAWGFLKTRDGKWCWVPWREYVFGDGKSAPCQ